MTARGILKTFFGRRPGGGVDHGGTAEVAGVVPRAFAAWLTLTVAGVAANLAALGDVPLIDGAVYLLSFAVNSWLYRRRGADLGKIVVGLRSVSYGPDLGLGWVQSAVRASLLLLVAGSALVPVENAESVVAIVFAVASLLVMLRSPDNQSITEMLAGTITFDNDPD